MNQVIIWLVAVVVVVDPYELISFHFRSSSCDWLKQKQIPMILTICLYVCVCPAAELAINQPCVCVTFSTTFLMIINNFFLYSGHWIYQWLWWCVNYYYIHTHTHKAHVLMMILKKAKLKSQLRWWFIHASNREKRKKKFGENLIIVHRFWPFCRYLCLCMKCQRLPVIFFCTFFSLRLMI